MLILKGQNFKLPTIMHILNESESICIMYDRSKPIIGGFYINPDETNFDDFILNLDGLLQEEHEKRACEQWDYIIIYSNEYEQNYHCYMNKLVKLNKYCVCLLITCCE
jgi:hypothetical protein